MLHMTTPQSWSTLLVALVIVATLMWLVIQIERRRRWRAAQLAEAASEVADDRKPARHLTLVPEPESARPELYDWRTQGI